MAILATPSIRLYRNPALKPGLAALVGWLLDHHYSSHAIGRIENFVAVHGTLAGSMIDPEDEPAAEETFCAALPAVPLDSAAWDRDSGVLFDVELLSRGIHPWPIPAVGDDDRAEPDDFAAAALEDLALPPVAGGSPDDESEPSEADWRDYSEWSEALEMERWYDERGGLAEFNRLRTD
jgi:hypothetical protein